MKVHLGIIDEIYVLAEKQTNRKPRLISSLFKARAQENPGFGIFLKILNDIFAMLRYYVAHKEKI